MTFEKKIKQFYYKKSRIQQYKGFCYTFQLGTTKKAGEKMGINPSAITMQIKALEDDLGVKLFHRTANHRLIATKEGGLLYNKLIILIQKLDGVIEEFLTTLKQDELQNINIGAHYTAISSILPNYIKPYLKDYLKTKFNIFNLPKLEALKKLKNNELDFIIYPFEENEKIPIELKFESIFEFKLVIIANRNHPIKNIKSNILRIDDIKKYKFFHISNYMISDMYKSFINKNDNKVNINLNMGNWDIAKNIVKSDICLSSVGRFYINENDEKDIIYKYCPDLFSNLHYAILTNKGKFINPIVSNIIKQILNNTINY